jgi:hypothetical protein
MPRNLVIMKARELYDSSKILGSYSDTARLNMMEICQLLYLSPVLHKPRHLHAKLVQELDL